MATTRKNLFKEMKKNYIAYLFISPFIIIFLLLMVFPFFFSMFLSFKQWKGGNSPILPAMIRKVEDKGTAQEIIDNPVNKIALHADGVVIINDHEGAVIQGTPPLIESHNGFDGTVTLTKEGMLLVDTSSGKSFKSITPFFISATSPVVINGDGFNKKIMIKYESILQDDTGLFCAANNISGDDWRELINGISPKAVRVNTSQLVVIAYNRNMLGNYITILTDPKFWNAVMNTLTITIFNVFFGTIISILLALALNSNIKFRNIFRALFFLPYITSIAVIAIIWKQLYHPSAEGFLNHLIVMMGAEPIAWLSNPKIALWCISAVMVWQYLGYDAILFLAGLQNISPTLYESANIDGATWMQKTWNITLPMLKPTTYFMVLIGVVGTVQVFDHVILMFSNVAGPLNQYGYRSVDTIVFYLYRHFGHLEYGMASATGYLLFMLTIGFSILSNKSFGDEAAF